MTAGPWHTGFYEVTGFGAMAATKPYEFIGFGAMDATKPSEFIGFGAMDATAPYEFIGFGATVPSTSPVDTGGRLIQGFCLWRRPSGGPPVSDYAMPSCT